MFQRGKQDSSPDNQPIPGRDRSGEIQDNPAPRSSAPARDNAPASSRRDAAVIGPSIRIDGDLRGEEDLIIEGDVKGTVHLTNYSLTIGSQGKVKADVYAHNIVVDGCMEGDLYGAERVNIRKSAQVCGNITSPRVSLEDGAQFKGSIEMDPQAEALQKAFGDRHKPAGSTTVSATPPAAKAGEPAAAAHSAVASSASSGDNRARKGSAG